MKSVGFIGLGDMGGPMARCIARAGLYTKVLDLRPEAVAHVVAAGAEAATDLADVAAGVDTVAICVVDDSQVLDLCLGRSGLLGAMTPDQLLVVHSSVSPNVIRRIGDEAATTGVRVVDAPVSGARMAAESGTLTVIVGGDPDDVARLGPLFDAIGSRVHHLGPLGAGLRGKIVNNLMVKGNHAVFLEALQLVAAFGLDEAEFLEVVRVSTGTSWVVETFPFLDDLLFDHTAAGTEKLYTMMTKELANALVAARELHVGLPVSGVVLQTYREQCIRRRDELERRGRSTG